MTKEPTHDLDALSDWEPAPPTAHDAGLVLRVFDTAQAAMAFLRKQAARPRRALKATAP